MAEYRKVSRLHNPPTKKRRKLSPKQIKFFGTTRQKAALKAKRSKARSPSTRAKQTHADLVWKAKQLARKIRAAGGPKAYREQRSKKNPAARKRGTKAYGRGLGPAPQGNIGEIITISLPNSGTRRKTSSMAKTKKRSNPNSKRRAAPASRRRASQGKVVYRYRTKRRKKARGRRNPAGLGITSRFTDAIGVVAGAGLNKMIVDGVLPAGLRSGMMGYLSTAVIAMASGPIVGNIAKNKKLGESITLGGWVALALRLANDFLPQIPLGLSLNGMGRVIPSQFAVPRVPIGNSFSRFVPPGWTPRALPPAGANGGSGVGAYGGRRMGRMA